MIKPQTVGVWSDWPDDPDAIPGVKPDAMVHVQGSAWCGSREVFEIVELRVVSDGEVIDCVMEAEMARDLLAALEAAIDAAKASADQIERACG